MLSINMYTHLINYCINYLLQNVTYWEFLSPLSSTLQHYKAEDHIMGSRTVNLMHHVMWLKTMQV